jgi:hypothetical protein
MAPPPDQPMQQPPAPPLMQWQPAPVPLQPDTVTEDTTNKEPTKLAWRGTTFTWNHSATTTLIGLGRDNIGGEDEVYSWAFLFRPNIYIVDLPKDKLTATMDIGWETELTNGLTTEKRETLFQDLTVGAKYARTLFESGGKDKGEYKTTVSLGGRLRFPTSKFSANQGKYLTTYLSPTLSQQIKILGLNAVGLNNITAAVSASWGHLADEPRFKSDPAERDRPNDPLGSALVRIVRAEHPRHDARDRAAAVQGARVINGVRAAREFQA